jgi:hypothetical protein
LGADGTLGRNPYRGSDYERVAVLFRVDGYNAFNRKSESPNDGYRQREFR